MCGIAGIVRLDGAAVSPEKDGTALRAQMEQIAHRGPDDEQVHFWANVALGFRRLSIVDPEGGRQPLFNESQTVALICNGEIYNHKDLRSRFVQDHRFRSNSDCEIIPHLYEDMGMSFLGHLNGIFGFALLDKLMKKLYLCRDRLGVKPLYYYRNKDALVFGSEVKAVLASPVVPKEFDWTAALTFRERMHYPHPAHQLTSFFKDIHYLPAGRYLEIDLGTGSVSEHVYWDPMTPDAGLDVRAFDRKGYVHRYHELLEDAVRCQLMSDVPCGVFLSGGIDSIAVSYFASKHSALHTFSVLSQSTLTNGDAPTAHRAARTFQLPNHMVLFDWRKLDVSPSLWRTILWKVETPIAGAEQFYKYLLHAHARQHVPGLKVMLLGSGSDEFNGGYSKTAFNSVKDPSWHNFEQTLEAYERQSLLQQSGAWNGYANVRIGGQPLISQDFLAELAHQRPYKTPWNGYQDMYRRLIQMYQLWHEDRTSAANGVEARVPFLDHRLVELTYAVPVELQKDLFWDKAILRDSLEGLLPDHFRQRPKTPFFVGEDQRYTRRLLYNLLCADGQALLEEALAEGHGAAGVLNADAVRRLFQELPNDPEFSNVDMVFDLVNMGLLAATAKREGQLAGFSDPLPVSEVIVDDWTKWEQRFGTSLVQRSPNLALDSLIRFADGIRLVKSEGGDPRMIDEGDYYILRNDDLEFSLEPRLEQWVKFLRLVNGVRSVQEILQEAGIASGDVWKHLEEAVEYDVLNVIPTVH